MSDGSKFSYIVERGSTAPGGHAEREPDMPARTRLRLRYVLVVWGEKYIERYFEFAFPTHLSPNNLPVLARHHDLSFAILTRAEDTETFKRHPQYQRLSDLGTVEFITIDDLISHPGVFTVTLTLAFTRAMRAAGAAATEINFIFMNADFILADGTLATVARRLQSGAKAVLSASPRSIAEEMGPRVAELPRNADGAITLAPRDAVAMALEAPHAMVFAKQPGLQLVHTIVPNQYFWFVDPKTLLARSFLMFMLAVRPVRPGYRATSYCDYSLVADLVDERDISVIDDSDDGFILELQSRTQELDTVRFGPLGEEAAIRHLAEWTTPHHRGLATFDLVFHSGPLPNQLATARTDAKDYIDRLLAGLPPPVDPHTHPYWLGGVRAWHYHRPDDPLPTEVEPFGKTSPRELAEEAAAKAATELAAKLETIGTPGESAHVDVAVEIPPASADSRGGRRERRFYSGIYDAMLPLRTALLTEPLHGDVSPAVIQVVRGGGNRQPVLLVGEPLGQVVRLLGSRASRSLPVTSLDGRGEMIIPEGSRVIVSLTDASLGRLAAGFKLAHQAVTGGGRAAIVVARQAKSVAEFNQALIEALMACEPSTVKHARSMVRDNDYFTSQRGRFQASLGELRRAPTSSRLVRAGVDLARLAAAQLRLRWPGIQISSKIETRLHGVVFLVGQPHSDRAKHARD